MKISNVNLGWEMSDILPSLVMNSGSRCGNGAYGVFEEISFAATTVNHARRRSGE